MKIEYLIIGVLSLFIVSSLFAGFLAFRSMARRIFDEAWSQGFMEGLKRRENIERENNKLREEVRSLSRLVDMLLEEEKSPQIDRKKERSIL